MPTLTRKDPRLPTTDFALSTDEKQRVVVTANGVPVVVFDRSGYMRRVPMDFFTTSRQTGLRHLPNGRVASRKKKIS